MCGYYHGQVDNAPPQGQNLANDPGNVQVPYNTIIEQWHAEVNQYDYATNACDPGRECGHYRTVSVLIG